ncbi:MAG: hypothetical protein ACTHMM_06075 [Agriterribacter sp.]
MPKTHIKTIPVKPPRIRRLHHKVTPAKPAEQKQQPVTPPTPMPPAQEQYLKVNKNDCL